MKQATDRAVCLVSGGLDSVVSLARALSELDVRLVLFFNYGQRALDRERNAVMGVVNYYELPLREVDLSWLRELAPEGMRYGAGSDAGLNSLEDVWIPNRNGLFVGVGGAFAEAYGCEWIVTGFNREEAAEFPDNTSGYVDAANAGLALSTRNRVRVRSFTQDLTKAEILLQGHELRAPLSVIWSCYRGDERMCGRCASCAKLRAALVSIPGESRPVVEFATD